MADATSLARVMWVTVAGPPLRQTELRFQTPGCVRPFIQETIRFTVSSGMQ